MKKFIFLLLPFVCMALDYEFLTPQTAVIKSAAPVKYTSKKIIKGGVWKKEIALLRDGKGNIQRKPDIIFFNYITFDKPLKNGEKIEIDGYFLIYDSNRTSPVFKLNQVGNGVKQQKKYAYIGAWLGSAGALPLKHLAGKNFEIRRVSDNKTVFCNTIKMRQNDPLYQYEIPFTGEEVAELDYSTFNIPGKYYFHIDGIGSSMDFTIGNETLNEAFYIHARGLYHKRCGIAKTLPFTAWTSPVCHQKVLQGTFPENAEHYRSGKNIEEGFVRKFKRLEIEHFELIKRNNLPDSNCKQYIAEAGMMQRIMTAVRSICVSSATWRLFI